MSIFKMKTVGSVKMETVGSVEETVMVSVEEAKKVSYMDEGAPKSIGNLNMIIAFDNGTL